jgi:hypothetical protein
MVSDKLQHLAQKARFLYNQRLRDELEKTHCGEFIAVEPDSGAYFLGKSMREALARAESAYPDRLFHVMCIGQEAAIHIGSHEV